jgi:hypothetical protein
MELHLMQTTENRVGRVWWRCVFATLISLRIIIWQRLEWSETSESLLLSSVVLDATKSLKFPLRVDMGVRHSGDTDCVWDFPDL